MNGTYEIKKKKKENNDNNNEKFCSNSVFSFCLVAFDVRVQDNSKYVQDKAQLQKFFNLPMGEMILLSSLAKTHIAIV